jgi:hypothetical protein
MWEQNRQTGRGALGYMSSSWMKSIERSNVGGEGLARLNQRVAPSRVNRANSCLLSSICEISREVNSILKPKGSGGDSAHDKERGSIGE